MFGSRAGREWQRFGEIDPYYGVWAIEEMRGRRPMEAVRNRFFASGEEYVTELLVRVRELAGPGFMPRRVLDYGCGVGRILIPLARDADRAVGLDVAPAMLEEAARNCAERHAEAELLRAEGIERLQAGFDLVHSTLVLQHMRVREGERVVGRMAALLRPGGVGAVQVTIGGSRWARLYNVVMKLPFVHNCANLVRRRPWSYPHMQMNVYDLGRLTLILRDAGAALVHLRVQPRSAAYDSCELLFRRAD